ncbi:MAG: hypothetical protein QOJ14_203 [Thermoleophilaceae bacterium]|nr:hypothetical protein [Thermoleophilaceae bacterium]
MLLAAALPAAARAREGHNPRGRMLGTVPAKTAVRGRARLAAPATTAAPSQLTYHGGPVVHDGHVYAIFWAPPGYEFPADYRDAVADYFTRVAADSGKRTNVYSVSRQYGDAIGQAEYRVAFERSLDDTTPFPAGDCSDGMSPLCVTDDQLTQEMRDFVTAGDLPRGLDSQYFLFLPPGVGSCSDSAGSECAYHDYCAYHTWTEAAGTVLYAVHPFVTGVDSCDMGESPTGTSADAVLNVVSHEHNEIVTDPVGTAWYDDDGEENADKCGWIFGDMQGGGGALYNQVIAGSPYLLQLEWSNRHRGCAASLPNQLPRASFASSGTTVTGSPVTFDASGAWDSDGAIAAYAWSFGDGARGPGRVAHHTYARPGRYDVRLTVTDDDGGSASSTMTVLVGGAAPARGGGLHGAASRGRYSGGRAASARRRGKRRHSAMRNSSILGR